MKRCTTCDFVKPLSEFYFEMDKKTLKPACKDCVKKRTRKWQADNPEQHKNNELKRKYNLTLEEMLEMIRQQANRCAICEDVFTDVNVPHVDHCHKTSDVRGILCHHCNAGLGLFRDSKKLLKEAIKYLGEHAQKRTATLVSAGHYIQGELYPELGPISATGAGEDDDYPHHHCGTVQREDVGNSTQASGGDSVAHRNKKVEPSRAFTRSQNNGDTDPEISRVELRGGRLFD